MGRFARNMLGCAALLCEEAASEVMMGISYGPTPVLLPAEASQMPEDDFFCDEAAPMWSSSGGRGDLKLIKALGANMVRLYGNDPRNSHEGFLQEADALGLQVAPGMSDWPFYQKTPGSCRDTDFDCYSQVKPLYMQNLANGFLTPEDTYHKSLRVMNILNEPDLKMPPTATNGGRDGPVKMARALISAFDAMLDAEKESNVTGPLINFTATFSFAVCSACDRFKHLPALGQMAQLDDAMRHPEAYGYTPKNDILEAYRTRWMHSFNTANPASDLEHMFFGPYAETFPETPVYIGEYHSVNARRSQKEDLDMVLGLARGSDLFVGISFFEFTVSYYKTGAEMDFGIFGYGGQQLASMPYFGKAFGVRCLTAETHGAGVPLAMEVAAAFGGALDTSLLCPTALPPPAPGRTLAAEALAAEADLSLAVAASGSPATAAALAAFAWLAARA